jgi:hypothetical protein
MHSGGTFEVIGPTRARLREIAKDCARLGVWRDHRNKFRSTSSIMFEKVGDQSDFLAHIFLFEPALYRSLR